MVTIISNIITIISSTIIGSIIGIPANLSMACVRGKLRERSAPYRGWPAWAVSSHHAGVAGRFAAGWCPVYGRLAPFHRRLGRCECIGLAATRGRRLASHSAPMPQKKAQRARVGWNHYCYITTMFV